MPKERNRRSVSFDRGSRVSPFQCSSSSSQQRQSSSSSRHSQGNYVATDKEIKEWEDVRCPVCMEHPHNAVLLLCSSYDKGCRPFMCDTSYRHSNCFDQFRKAFSASKQSENDGDQAGQKLKEFPCPLCRGCVNGWKALEPARCYMNARSRSCSSESCGFSGPYQELRKHARSEHPSIRPSEADPERERDWRRMEQQRDLGDLLSTIQSAFQGERRGEVDDEIEGSVITFPSVAIYFVLRVRRHMGTGSGQSFLRSPGLRRLPARVLPRSRRGVGTVLWGETFSEPESVSRVSLDTDGDPEEDEGRSEDTPDGSQGGQGRSRWWSRLPEDDEVL